MATLPKVLINRADYQIGGGVALRLRTQGGLPYEDAGASQIRQLRWLGVTDIMQFPEPTLELKVKARCFRHGATSISSDP
jgi:hypothetical protein